MISLWFLKFSETNGDQYFGVFICFRGAVFLPSPYGQAVLRCVAPHTPISNGLILFPEAYVSTHPALTPGLVEPCFYSGAFFLSFLFSSFFPFKVSFFFPFSFAFSWFSHLIFLCFFFFFQFGFCCGGGCFSCFGFVFAVDFLYFSSLPFTLIFPTPQNVLKALQKVGASGPGMGMGGGMTGIQPEFVSLGAPGRKSPASWV